DHMSPISDTTILSSICSGCDHMDHVRTQIPYAMTGFVAASVAGYGMVGAFGAPLWLGYFTGVAIVTGTVFLLGRRADLVSA
ncbi:Na+/H+ antiporter NhaC family protein, partial [Myxococcota bacterium]|nr:Na+/H+ antiporter NhaC family protein [Myxococcota bacterium]